MTGDLTGAVMDRDLPIVDGIETTGTITGIEDLMQGIQILLVARLQLKMPTVQMSSGRSKLALMGIYSLCQIAVAAAVADSILSLVLILLLLPTSALGLMNYTKTFRHSCA